MITTVFNVTDVAHPASDSPHWNITLKPAFVRTAESMPNEAVTDETGSVVEPDPVNAVTENLVFGSGVPAASIQLTMHSEEAAGAFVRGTAIDVTFTPREAST